MRPVNKPPLSSTLETPRSDIALKKKISRDFQKQNHVDFLLQTNFSGPFSEV